MPNTPNLNLQRLVAGQASAEITHNNALNVLDGLVFLALITRGTNTPPGSPAEGDAHLVGSAPTGAWTGQAGKIALYYGGWVFVEPNAGFIARSLADSALIQFDGTNWQTIDTGAVVQQVGAQILTPQSGDNVSLLYTSRAITITSVRSVVNGTTPSVQWNIRHSTTRNAGSPSQVFTSNQTTTNQTTGANATSGFSANAIAAGRFVWLAVTAAPTGTVNFLETFVSFTVDPV